MSDAEMTDEEVERSASVLQRIVDAEMDNITRAVAEQVYGHKPLFFQMDNKKPRDRRPIYGPPTPSWRFEDLDVSWNGAEYLSFNTPGWESETAHLDRGDVRELRDMLTRWLGDGE